MFDIAFLSSVPQRQPEGWSGLRGRTQLGSFTEEFVAPLGLWQRDDYERHWIDAAHRLLGLAARSAFFTSTFQFWWVMWRDGEDVIVQHQLIVPERLEGLTDSRCAPYQIIDDRQSTGDVGEPISQWSIGVADVEGFLARRQSQYAPP